MLLSLFCGPGGLDLGFEQAGFKIALAFDKNPDSIKTYNSNRANGGNGHVADIRNLSVTTLDDRHGKLFKPAGVIGGPPCQSFSQANQSQTDDDPRHSLPLHYAALLKELNDRSPVSFFVLENVPGLSSPKHRARLDDIIGALSSAGFNVFESVLNSVHYSTPQARKRLFLVGLNSELFHGKLWHAPAASTKPTDDVSVAGAIAGLPEPAYWDKNSDSSTFPAHPNHWCMRPKSTKFLNAGSLVAGKGTHRSFKTLAWERPSITVAYGNREVHIHPGCHRRLSVYEAMLLQGFPHEYVLKGSLSSQIVQVSEAVPPPLAYAIATTLLPEAIGRTGLDVITPSGERDRSLAAAA